MRDLIAERCTICNARNASTAPSWDFGAVVACPLITARAAAIASTHVQRAMAEGQRGGPAKVLRVIVVPKRLVNVVLAAPA